MSEIRSSFFACVRVCAALVVMIFAGCAGPGAADVAPRMPTMLPRGPETPPSVISGIEVREKARALLATQQAAEAARLVGRWAEPDRSAVVRELVAGTARENPPQAVAFALALPEGRLQDEALATAAGAWWDRDPEGAIGWALTLDQVTGFWLRQALAEAMVQREAGAALDRLLKLPASEQREDLITLTAARWARREATPALAWVNALPAGALKTRVTTGVGFELAQTEPARGLEIAAALPEGRDRALLYSMIGQTWVARDADGAWAWARQLPAGATREAALAGIETGLGIASRRGEAGLPAAADAVFASGGAASSRDVAMLPPGAERDRRLRRQFEDLLLSSPVRAADWIATLPPGDRSDEMVERLTREWFAQNPAAAAAWVEQNIVSRPQREHLLREARR